MKDFPVIKFTIFFIAGIIIQLIFPICLKLNLFLLGGSIILFLSIFFFERKLTLKTLTSMILFIIFVLIGYTSGNIQQKNRIFLPDSLQVIKDIRAYGKVTSIDLPGEDGFSFLLKADSIKAAKTINAEIFFICKLYDKNFLSTYDKILPGNSIEFTGTYHRGRNTRNPGEFDYNKYLHNRNISGILTSYNIEDVRILKNTNNIFEGIIHSIRINLDHIISKLHTNETKGLLRGLLLADRSEIDSETMTQFINSGVVHILSVSGLHVAFIALIFYTIFGRLNQYLRGLLTIFGILLFMLITGNPASVFRSAVMAIVVIYAFLSNRSSNIYNSLSIAALIILTLDPSELFDPGFQLSFSAVFSIAYFYPIIRRQILKINICHKLIKDLFLFSAVSLSAQIGTLPFTLFYFGKLSTVAIFANLFVIPLSGFIIGGAIITLLLYPFSILAASVYAFANNLLSHLLYLIVKFSGTMEYAFVDIKNYSLTDAIIFYGLLFGGIIIIKQLSAFKAKLIVALLILGNIGLFTTLDDSTILNSNNLNVYMIDVGQGDSFLVMFPGGKTALIDAGNATPFYDNGERIILPLLQTLGINKIDYGFVSHIDADHYGGFISLIEKCKVNKIFKPALINQSDKDLRFEKYLKSKNIPFEYYSKKDIKINNTAIYILNDSAYDLNSFVTSNDRSGILKIVYGSTSFLFTGDLEKNGELYYSEYYKNFLNSDVLKIGHHGSKYGSSDEFISLVTPQISLISCGVKNSFNHPSNEVITRLKKSCSVIYRTDLQGGILLQSDGNRIQKIHWLN